MQPPPRGRTLRRRSPRWASPPPALRPSAPHRRRCGAPAAGGPLRRRPPGGPSTPPAIMPSATYAQVPIADVFDERLGRPLREVGAVLAAVGFPEVLAPHPPRRRAR